MLHRHAGPVRRLFAAFAIAAFALPTCPGASEPPPAQGTRLHFRKVLTVQKIGSTRVFAERRIVRPGDTLWKLLRDEYRVARSAMPAFLRAFRGLNPEADPDRLRPGQVVKIPFKIEEVLGGGPEGRQIYVVKPGDSLWKILRNRYGVPRAQMAGALEAVARANPQLRDLNRLYVGQRIRIPARIARAFPPPARARASRDVLELLQALGCRVSTKGETYLPLGRGRTLRLDAGDFPWVVGPSGRKVVLDPANRIPPALAQEIRAAWGYGVVSGWEADPELQLAKILPLLGFHELSPGVRTVSLGGGAELVVQARWSVVPRPEDLWEGQIHLILPAGAVVEPVLLRTLNRLGMAVHVLGPASVPASPAGQSVPQSSPPMPPDLPARDRIRCASRILSLLGIPHRIRPVVECSLGGGISYRLRPEMTFRHLGLRYAVAPRTPQRAPELLSRAGYFVLEWAPDTDPLAVLRDLFGLVGVSHAVVTVELPPDQSVRLRLRGLTVDSPELASLVYPNRPGKLFLTQAPLDRALAGLLARQGLLPWILADR